MFPTHLPRAITPRGLPAPAIRGAQSTSSDLQRRQTVAGFLPRVVVRLTLTRGASATSTTYTTSPGGFAEPYRWATLPGFTFEVHAVWSLEPGPNPSLRSLPSHDPVEAP